MDPGVYRAQYVVSYGNAANEGWSAIGCKAEERGQIAPSTPRRGCLVLILATRATWDGGSQSPALVLRFQGHGAVVSRNVAVETRGPAAGLRVGRGTGTNRQAA